MNADSVTNVAEKTKSFCDTIHIISNIVTTTISTILRYQFTVCIRCVFNTNEPGTSASNGECWY
jgi:hypothetical protein